MSKLIAALALIVVGASANALATNSKDLICSEIKAKIAKGGRTSLVAYPDGPYQSRTFVSGSNKCVNSNKKAYSVSIEARDGVCFVRSCFANADRARHWDRNH